MSDQFTFILLLPSFKDNLLANLLQRSCITPCEFQIYHKFSHEFLFCWWSLLISVTYILTPDDEMHTRCFRGYLIADVAEWTQTFITCPWFKVDWENSIVCIIFNPPPTHTHTHTHIKLGWDAVVLICCQNSELIFQINICVLLYFHIVMFLFLKTSAGCINDVSVA